MAVKNYEQAKAVLQSIGMQYNLEAAHEYGQTILEAVRIIRDEEE